MTNLEAILHNDFSEFTNFYRLFLDLNSDQLKEINQNKLEFVVSDKITHYAALEFSHRAYKQSFRPEAVHNSLARAEENGHYFNLVLSPEQRINLLQAQKDSEQYLKLEYRAEYIARLMALIYLDYKGIKRYNQIWSSIDKNKIILSTEPLHTKAHYLGYTKAEKDFATLTPHQLKEKFKRILYNNSLSEFSDTNRQKPEIVTPSQLYKLAA